MQGTQSIAIQQALQRIALFRLAHLFAKRKQGKAHVQRKRQTIWEQIITASNGNDEQMRTLIGIVYSCCQSRIAEQAIYVNYKEINEAAKQQTKRLIVKLILTQSKLSAVSQLFVGNQGFEKNSTKNSFPQAFIQIFDQSQLISSSECHKIQKIDNLGRFQRKENELFQQKLGKPDSEWEKTQETAISSGHFLYGDKMSCIRSLLVNQGQIFGMVQWKQHKRIKLSSSVLPLESIREHAPRELASYLQTYAKDLGLS